MADMTREEAIKQLSDIRFQFQSSMDEADVDKDCREAYEDNKATVDAIDFALADMKRVEELETENKRLKDGIEKVKAEIEIPANTDFIPGTFVNGVTECKDIINKHLGE